MIHLVIIWVTVAGEIGLRKNIVFYKHNSMWVVRSGMRWYGMLVATAKV